MTSALFEPLTLRGTTFRNRAWVAPMCQYSSSDGLADRLAPRAPRRLRERPARASSSPRPPRSPPEGRITPEDIGLWYDEHAEALGAASSTSSAARAPSPASSSRTPGARPRPTRRGAARGSVPPTRGGWESVGPSSEPFGRYAAPRAMTDRRDRCDARAPSPPPRVRADGRRLRHGRAARRARLPAPPVPLAAVEPARRRVRRHPREPDALPARGRRRACAPSGPTSSRCSCASRRPTGSRAAGTSSSRSCSAARLRAARRRPRRRLQRRQRRRAQAIPLGPGYQVPFAAAIRAATPASRPAPSASSPSRRRPRRSSRRAARPTSCCSRARCSVIRTGCSAPRTSSAPRWSGRRSTPAPGSPDPTATDAWSDRHTPGDDGIPETRGDPHDRPTSRRALGNRARRVRPARAGAFYSALLGWPIAYDDPEWAMVKPADGGWRGLSFQREPDHVRPRWPAGPLDQQMQAHLDIAVDDLEDGVAYAVEPRRRRGGAPAAGRRPRPGRSRRPPVLSLRLARPRRRRARRVGPRRVGSLTRFSVDSHRCPSGRTT